MTRTLVRKELRQHWLPMLLLALGTMFGYSMIIVATLTRGQAGSGFEVLRLFLMLMGPLAGVLLCHRLVVLEYQARTQLFLEGLPLTRWRMVSVKYVLGLCVIFLLAGVAYVIACGLSWRREFLTPRFLAIIALRSGSVVWFIYSFCFLLGLLGRYRVALYLITFIAIGMLFEHTQLQLAHFGPIELLDGRFAYEAETIPWKALRVTWLLGLAFMTLTAVLSLIREGSVAALLAEKMSHKEKVFIAATLFGLLEAASLLSEKTKRVPFDLHDAVVEQRPGILVKVATGPRENAQAARELATYVASELAGARDYLGLEKLPTVFITRRRDLDASHYERGQLEGNDGVQVRANFETKDWDARRFETWLLGQVLVVNSRERAELESRRWVLDGFPLFWTWREHNPTNLASDSQLALRALYGAASGFSARDLKQWLSFRERVGEDIASGVAWSGLRVLARSQGQLACQKFLRRVLGVHPPKDIRAVFGGQAAPMEQLLQSEGGTELQTFFAKWQDELAQARRTLETQLNGLPRLKGSVKFVPLSRATCKATYQLTLEPAPVDEVRFSFLHSNLSAYDEEVSPESIQREQDTYPQHARDELPDTLSRGGRLFWTFAMEVPELGCQVISGWTRQGIE